MGKVCKTCNLELDLDRFEKMYVRKDGSILYRTSCMQCYNLTRRAYYNQWRRTHKEYHRNNQSERRARQKGAKTTKVNFNEILMRDGSVCYLCNCSVPLYEIHYDHVLPLSRGGSHSVDNIKVTHAVCNLRKGTKTVEEYFG